MFRRLVDALSGKKPPPASPISTDHAGDRETNRVSRLSSEDQAWEAASQQRSREQPATSASRAAATEAEDLASGAENAS